MLLHMHQIIDAKKTPVFYLLKILREHRPQMPLIKGHRGLPQHVVLLIGCTFQLQPYISMQETSGSHMGEVISLYFKFLWHTCSGE